MHFPNTSGHKLQLPDYVGRGNTDDNNNYTSRSLPSNLLNCEQPPHIFSSLTPTFAANNTMNNPYQSQVPHLPISLLLVTPQTPVCMTEWHRFLNYTHPSLIIQPI